MSGAVPTNEDALHQQADLQQLTDSTVAPWCIALADHLAEKKKPGRLAFARA